MTEELGRYEGPLSLDEEFVLITAENHDLAGFTPELLRSKSLVEIDWVVGRFVRSPSEVVIGVGPVQWYMTDTNLWISRWPACELGGVKDHSIIPRLAQRFLAAFPDLPARKLWFYWRLSDQVLGLGEWPFLKLFRVMVGDSSEVVSVGTTLDLVRDDYFQRVQVTHEGSLRSGQSQGFNRVSFGCTFAKRYDLNVQQMNSETENWSLCLGMAEELVRELLTGSD